MWHLLLRLLLLLLLCVLCVLRRWCSPLLHLLLWQLCVLRLLCVLCFLQGRILPRHPLVPLPSNEQWVGCGTLGCQHELLLQALSTLLGSSLACT
jgi:hypothetical protein